MVVIEYHCDNDGLVAAFGRAFLESTNLPELCPLCGSSLRCEVNDVAEYPAAS